MALCNQIVDPKTPQHIKDRILQFYGHNFSFEVRYYLADFIEDRFL